ncbi:alpha-amylase family glycosyl hydrolase [Mycoplasmopsis glycophila]|uniref:Pullulanase n=1 Tax=Mycoplasmopsis glycophila TaxID=171285 RepID=A0A449AWH3_9BACT|nr:alpha-amylase family glycosyl hydrolase [Mycoplasmopsis glycophila]VEU71083.1 Pullulanase [Mycoplasmopsis glycophila]
MKLKYQNKDFFKKFDNEYAYKKGQLGIFYKGDHIFARLWQPLAENVELLIFAKDDQDRLIKTLQMSKKDTIWEVKISKDFDEFYYQFKVTQDGKTNVVLDPYAYSMAPFNWEGQEVNVGKGAFVDFDSPKAGKMPREVNLKTNYGVDPIVYELHTRDFTSLLNPKQFKSRLGTFNAMLEHKVFKYLKSLGVTHLQLLPLQSTYTVNEFDLRILQKGDGEGWLTNYNWGYDPHNYFTLNGIYSSDPSKPYARIKEFRKFVDEAHKNNIGVIVDVVYNHMFTNRIYDDIIDGYYYRDNAVTRPVSYPPLADERYMARRIIVDSLKMYVEKFDVDGFRFDLSCFLHKETIDEIDKELRKIKPNIVLHGEAWAYTDLNTEQKEAYIKGSLDNNLQFGYFSDTLRDAIKGFDMHGGGKGLIASYDKNLLERYIVTVTGGLKTYNYNFLEKVSEYDAYTSDPRVNLSYASCHDGSTLWDKINFSTEKLSFIERLERYRQGLLMTTTTMGRQFMLAGTELLQTKPYDKTGVQTNDMHKSNYRDNFGEHPDDNKYEWNSYKTTDYVNGLKWKHLENENVQKYIFEFVQKLNKWRNKTRFFRLDNLADIEKALTWRKVDFGKGILIFELNVDNKTIQVIHNFGNSKFKYDIKGKKILFNSKINQTNLNYVYDHTSMILELKNKKGASND